MNDMCKSSARVNGASLTHRQFKEFVKAFTSLFKSETSVLEKFEEDENLLSLPFCICYARLLEDRMRYCITCSEYYRSMAERSFWFMKPLVLRRAMKFESIHYETLGRLTQLRIYQKLYHNYTPSTL